MTNLELVCYQFNVIKANSSRLAKEQILRNIANEPEEAIIAKEFFSIALSWYRHYGIRSLPQPQNVTGMVEPTWDTFVDIVESLEKDGPSGVTWSRQMIANWLHQFDPSVEHWLRRCLLKDLDMGVSYLTVNKIWPGLIETYEVMLANTLSSLNKLTYPIAVEPKIDGVRCIATVSNGVVTFLGRSGNELYNCEEIGEELLLPDTEGMVFDGELYNGSFPTTMQVVRRDVNSPPKDLQEKLRFIIFDGMSLPEWKNKICLDRYLHRQEVLTDKLYADDDGEKVRLVGNNICFKREQAERYVKQHLEAGYEGSMFKQLEGGYVFGRSANWLKYKPEMTDDFPIIGVYAGSGRNKHRLGGFVIDDNGKKTKVGGGFTDVERETYWVDPPIGRIAEVKYKWKTPDGYLREPVFVRLRDDKAVDI